MTDNIVYLLCTLCTYLNIYEIPSQFLVVHLNHNEMEKLFKKLN